MVNYNTIRTLIICLSTWFFLVPSSSKADGNLYRGKHLYFKKCMNCHNQQVKLLPKMEPVYPDKFTRRKWELLLNKYGKATLCSRNIKGLSETDKTDILFYLQHNAYDSGKRVRCDD